MLARLSHKRQNAFSKRCSPCGFAFAPKNACLSVREFFWQVKRGRSTLCCINMPFFLQEKGGQKSNFLSCQKRVNKFLECCCRSQLSKKFCPLYAISIPVVLFSLLELGRFQNQSISILLLELYSISILVDFGRYSKNDFFTISILQN